MTKMDEGKLKLGDRVSWGALPAIRSEPLPNPIIWLRYILDTGTPPCTSHEECCKTLQGLQLKHMQEGLGDIRYNFLVSSEGVVYEGRGWKVKPPRDDTLADYDGRFMEIAFIGNYTNETWRQQWFDSPMYEAQFSLLEYGEENKHLSEEYQYIPLKPELVPEKYRDPPPPEPMWEWTLYEPGGNKDKDKQGAKGQK